MVTPGNSDYDSPRVRRYCGLGSHTLRPPHKTVASEGMLRYAQKLNSNFRRSTLICGVCFDTLKRIYRLKLRHALEHQKKPSEGNTNSLSDISSSQPAQASQSSSSDDGRSTSATKRKRPPTEQDPKQHVVANDGDDEDDDDERLSLNAVNGTRLPHIQPAPKRRQFVHLNKDVMDIYLAGTTGG